MRAIAILGSALLSGCASMINYGNQTVTLHTSNNKPAQVKVTTPDNMVHQGTIPGQITVKPSSFLKTQIEITDPCYQNTRTHLRESVAPTYFLNLLNLHGLYIDYLSGYMWKVDSPSVISLQARADASPDCDQTERLASIPPLMVIPANRRNTRIDGGMLIPYNGHSGFDGYGYFIAISRKLSDEMVANVELDFSNGSEYISSSSSTLGYYNYSDMHYNQTTVRASLRQFINPDSGIFVGIGAAAMFYTLNYYRNTDSSYEDVRTVISSGTNFLETGWRNRKANTSISITGSLDISEFGLSRPYIKKRDDDTVKISDERDRADARKFMKNTLNSSYIAVSGSLAF